MKSFLIFFLLIYSALSARYDGDLSRIIIKECSKELAKTKRLQLTGSGGSMPADIKAIAAHYDYTQENPDQKIDIKFARRLYVNIVETFIKRTNETGKIRPYLHNFPFTAKNVSCILSFNTPDGKIVQSGYIADVMMVNGVITYSVYVSKNNPFHDVYEEPYEEALKIVQRERGLCN